LRVVVLLIVWFGVSVGIPCLYCGLICLFVYMTFASGVLLAGVLICVTDCLICVVMLLISVFLDCAYLFVCFACFSLFVG